jgi:hypothetical protein
MASKKHENSLDFQGQFKPRSPDLSASDFALFAKETFNRRPLQVSKKMELEIKQSILQFPYKPKVPACPANLMKRRLEFAEELLRFQDK